MIMLPTGLSFETVDGSCEWTGARTWVQGETHVTLGGQTRTLL